MTVIPARTQETHARHISGFFGKIEYLRTSLFFTMNIEHPLYPVIVLLAAGILGLLIARALRFSPIIGFFLIGAAIGSSGFNLVDSHSPSLHFLGELGVCFLLFDVGLHLSIKELRQEWRAFVRLGLVQFLFGTAAIAGAAHLVGLPTVESFTLGAILSLSSTALVLKMLSDEQEQSSPVGRHATQVLVFQDIVAITLLVFLVTPAGDGFDPKAFAMPALKMAAVSAVMIGLGRKALKPLFRILIALKNDEVFTALALLLVFATSAITDALGLSLALGAFLGGLALSESSYSYLVRTEVAPFRSLLLSLFFLTIGMGLDISGIWNNAALYLSMLVLFTAAKVLGNRLAFGVAGLSHVQSTLLSFLLAQGSEFAFVLLSAARAGGFIGEQTFMLASTGVGLSLAVTPLVGGIGCYWSRSACTIEKESEAQSSADETPEVVVIQLDEFGREIAGYLADAGIAYRGHDRDIERLTFAKSRGLNVYYADLARPRTVARASTGHVLAVVSLLEDDHIIDEFVTAMKRVAPHVPIVSATSDPRRFERLTQLGLRDVFIKSREAVPAILETLFSEIRLAEAKAAAVIGRAKAEVADPVFGKIPSAVLSDEAIAAVA